MTDKELMESLGKSEGFIARVEIVFEDAPEADSWIKFWVVDEESKVNYLAALIDYYESQGYYNPTLKDITKEEMEFKQAVTALLHFPTWEELTQRGLITSLINPN